MLRRLIDTENRLAPVILRVALALVIFPHGAQKALGWFGGGGIDGTVGYFAQNLGIPAALTALVIAAEFLGPIGLAAGFLTRAAAAGIGAVMVGAAIIVHAPNGFFMNWSGAQAGEGFEFHILALGIALALIVTGGGSLSIDRLLTERDVVRRAERGGAVRPEPVGEREVVHSR